MTSLNSLNDVLEEQLVDLYSAEQQLIEALPKMAQAASIEHVKAGMVRGIAVTTATRSQALPDLPAVAEFLPGYEASALYGMAAPRGTPTVMFL